VVVDAAVLTVVGRGGGAAILTVVGRGGGAAILTVIGWWYWFRV